MKTTYCDACHVAKAMFTVFCQEDIRLKLALCHHHFKKAENSLREKQWIILESIESALRNR